MPKRKKSDNEETRIGLQKFYEAVEATADSVFITTKEGKIEYANRSFERVTGFRRQDVLGKTPRIIKSGLLSNKFYERLWSTILAGKTFRAKVINRRKNGKLFWADHTITPILNRQGKVVNFVGIWKDITISEQIENLYRSGLKLLTPLTIPETCEIITKEALRILNAAHGALFLWKNSELERVWGTLESQSQEKLLKFAIKAAKYDELKVEKREEIVDLKSRSKKVIKWAAYIPLSYKKRSLGIIAVYSFSENRTLSREKAMLRIFASFASMAIRKAQLYKELADSLKTRDLFISLASHELRTPITTLNLYSDLINKTLSKGKKPKREWARVVHWETIRLIMMVNELFQIDQIKTGKLEYHWKPVNLRILMRRVIIDFRAVSHKRKLIFKDKLMDEKAVVMGDFDKLIQAFLNILNNAAKFSLAYSTITVELSQTLPYFVLKVKDEGSGISEEDLPRIFEGFYKGKQSLKEGLGIGLYLTRSIIEMHRGKINIDSVSGKGTTVTILLPKS
ncbi:hypothetical protein A2870_01465 [Candidatus Curtissbacteria bacterium RIFCSPHIGHO2_01_FULL_41_11]|uniref:histidine kinase n=1 Tax=Candidatus Curtissbacteria bacterium RIFCSPHIGHO2_01_FULL_41_11 TaxID=1797711 RepID=A0A1F5G6E4_9BACT|nr:MAG: hypothetical protein A2870_01465 [Candidatus Curtissbacteria bacterium RIFCSPHIGHO2_01_FULL_41_11]